MDKTPATRRQTGNRPDISPTACLRRWAWPRRYQQGLTQACSTFSMRRFCSLHHRPGWVTRPRRAVGETGDASSAAAGLSASRPVMEAKRPCHGTSATATPGLGLGWGAGPQPRWPVFATYVFATPAQRACQPFCGTPPKPSWTVRSGKQTKRPLSLSSLSASLSALVGNCMGPAALAVSLHVSAQPTQPKLLQEQSVSRRWALLANPPVRNLANPDPNPVKHHETPGPLFEHCLNPIIGQLERPR